MTAGVLDQVVAAHEALVAQRALEAFFPCVGTSVAGELIGAGKLLHTVRPDARKGPLTWTRRQQRAERNQSPGLQRKHTRRCFMTKQTNTQEQKCYSLLSDENRFYNKQLHT